MIDRFKILPMRSLLPLSRWLVCPRPDLHAPMRLWCLPFAGGGAAVWHPWAGALAGIAEVVAVRPPGRESRFIEPAFVDLREMIPPLVEVIAPFAHEDYALCGHSLGGLVAYELARALRSHGLGAPRALVLCAVRAPHHAPDEPWLHRLPRLEFIESVEHRYGAIPPEIRDSPEVLDLLLPVLRADLQAYETYRHVPDAPLAIPVLALGGEQDGNVSRPQLLDWRDYTTGPFEAGLLPGGHFFPQENFAPTVERVRDYLARCGGVSPRVLRHADGDGARVEAAASSVPGH
jgi:medium-chain acyl-[acyl-carrier-protein] hydrolase